MAELNETEASEDSNDPFTAAFSEVGARLKREKLPDPRVSRDRTNSSKMASLFL